METNPQDFGSYVASRADIVKTISAFIDVQQKGSSYVAVCPFHHDTNPSLSISPAKNIFKCFVCQTGGNAISFVMKFLNIPYREAMRKVCEINGIPLPKDWSKARGVNGGRTLDPALSALKDLSDFYRLMLQTQEGEAAKAYLAKRQLDSDVQKAFGIGYAPKDSRLAIRFLREKKGYSVETLEKAGIISAYSKTLADRYSGRIMFPILNADGMTVAFSGRKFYPEDNSLSKYINSPETPYFHKGEILYGFSQAKASVPKEKVLFVTEGFMDVIALYRAGIHAAVALMGTILTPAHMALLKSLNALVILSLDSDAAGQNGMRIGAESLTKEGILYKLTRPFPAESGKDADEVLDKLGVQGLRKAMSLVSTPLDYALDSLDPLSPDLLETVSRLMATHLKDYRLLSPEEKQLTIQKISRLTGLSERYVSDRMSADASGDNPTGSREPVAVVPEGEAVSGEDAYWRLAALAEQRLKTKARLEDGSLDFRLNAYRFLFSKEAQILVKLPLSEEACEMYGKEVANGAGIQIPVFRALAGYILALREEGRFGRKGFLDADQIYGIQAQIAEESVTLGPNEDLDGFSDQDINDLLSDLTAQSEKDFNPSDFKGILWSHEEALERQRMALAKEKSGDGTESAKEVLENGKRIIKIVVPKTNRGS